MTNLSDQLVLLGRRLLRTSTVTLVSGFIPGVELLSFPTNIHLVPVGSTVHYEMMKLGTGSV